MYTTGVIAPRLLLTRCATTSRPAKNRRPLGRAGYSCGPIVHEISSGTPPGRDWRCMNESAAGDWEVDAAYRRTGANTVETQLNHYFVE